MCFNMPRHMGRGIGLAKIALGMGALRAANTAARAAAWSSYPRYHSYYRPYGYYDYYDPYYGSGYYGYSYGSSRGAGWFIAAFLVAVAGACCLLIPGIAGIICCGVGIAAALGLTIGGIVATNSTPSTVFVRNGNNPSKLQEQSQEQSQSQNKGNYAEKSPVKYAKPQSKEKQICTTGKENYFSGYSVKSGKKPQQMGIAISNDKSAKSGLKEINIKNHTMCVC